MMPTMRRERGHEILGNFAELWMSFGEVSFFIIVWASTRKEIKSLFPNICKVFIFLTSVTLLFWNNFGWLWVRGGGSKFFAFLWT